MLRCDKVSFKMASTTKYGVHLSIPPAGVGKRVTIHRLPCYHYKQHKQTSKGMYSFDKNCADLRSAIEKASEFALFWNASISVCKDCFETNIQSRGA